MKPVLTPDQASALDRASQARGISDEALMERAGRAVARSAVDVMGGSYGRRAVVVCGKGNNGGDGLVAARHLARWGVRVCVVAVEPFDDLREPAATNAARLDEVPSIRVVRFDHAVLDRELRRADVVIDALFGTGFRGIPEDDWADAIAGLNASPSPVVAVDIPSGVNGATGAVEGDAVRADLTVTFGAPKVGVVLLPGAELAGAVRVADIGFPSDLIVAEVFLTDPDDVNDVLPEREIDTHKRATGVLVVVAGSRRHDRRRPPGRDVRGEDRRGPRPGRGPGGHPADRAGGSGGDDLPAVAGDAGRHRRDVRLGSAPRACWTVPTHSRSVRASPRMTRLPIWFGGWSATVRCRSSSTRTG